MAIRMIETISKLLTTDGYNNRPVILKELENGCIICISHKGNHDGYLRLRYNGKMVYAHRIVYRHFYEPIPEGMCICHHCDNPGCLTPAHFFAGTKADNNHDKAMKGRGTIGNTWSRGERCGTAKLTAEQVLTILHKYKSGEYLQRELALEFGVSRTQISFITNRKRWAHLEAA